MILRRAASLVLAAACFTCAAGAVLTTGPAAQAAPATAYRYWTYWYGNGASWELGRTGPPNALKDGAVVGWRFSISPDSQSDVPPRAVGDFTAICGSTPAADGKYRVAVVLDYGLAADAPSGETPPRSTPVSYCAVLGAQHNGYFATQANGHTIRVNSSGLVCGIDGYPKTECGDAVSTPVATSLAPSPKASVVPTKQPGGSTGPPTATEPAGPSAPSTLPTGTSPGTTTATSPSLQAPEPSSAASDPSATASASADTTPLPSDIAAHGTSGNGHLPVGLIAGGVLVAALATAATLRGRRR